MRNNRQRWIVWKRDSSCSVIFRFYILSGAASGLGQALGGAADDIGGAIGNAINSTIFGPLSGPIQYAQRCPTGEELAAQKASSYVFRAKIDGKYFDQLDSWCLKNPVVTKNISNGLYSFSGLNKINFENKSNTLRLLINSVDGDFDISTDGLVGHTAHHTKENHNNISTAFSSLLSLNTDSILSDSEKDDQSKELVYQISKANANLVLLLKEGSLSTIDQVLDDTFDVLKHQRTAAQQFGASIEFREWLKNKDGVNKTRLFIKEDSLYGTDRNERFFSNEDLFREGSGIVDNTFKTGENIDIFDDYSDDRDFCNFYPDSAIDVSEISLFTGQTIGTSQYIPTDCAAGHLSNLIKKVSALNNNPVNLESSVSSSSGCPNATLDSSLNKSIIEGIRKTNASKLVDVNQSMLLKYFL